MKFNMNVYSHLYNLCSDFIYHVCTYFELRKKFPHFKADFEFWVYTSDAHFQMAVLRWCSVFGTNSESTHWKKLLIDKKEFIDYLLKELSLTQKVWDEYWNQMMTFRNEYVAHRSVGSPPTPAFFDFGVRAVICLEAFARDKLLKSIVEEGDARIKYLNDTLPMSQLMKEYQQSIAKAVKRLAKHFRFHI